jgi:hypothetical protein
MPLRSHAIARPLLIGACICTSLLFFTGGQAETPTPPDEETILYFPLVFKYLAPGAIQGNVQDALTGNPIQSAEVCIDSGCTLTDDQGNYEFTEVLPGNMFMTVTANDYLDAENTVPINPGELVYANFALSPDLLQGIRIVLTWDETIRFNDPVTGDWIDNDMDAYLWAPTPTGHQQIYWNYRGDCFNDPYACLERDWTQGFGPETDLITEQSSGSYIYAVNYYADSIDINNAVPPITQSSARVEVYDTSGLLATFDVPTSGAGTWWHVFSMDGDTGILTPINVIDHGPPSP